MRIDDQFTSGNTAATQTGQTNASAETSRRTAVPGASQQPDGSSDKVELSSGGGLTSLAMAVEDPARAEKLQRLAQQVQSGQYSVSPEDLSKKIVNSLYGSK